MIQEEEEVIRRRRKLSGGVVKGGGVSAWRSSPDLVSRSRLISHLEGEHMAFFGTDYLIAGCTMSGEERTAIQVVGIIYLLNYPRSSHLLPTLRTW